MKAKVKELWLIVECPHCLKPHTVQKHIFNNMAIGILKVRYESCEFCDKGYFIELEESDDIYGLS